MSDQWSDARLNYFYGPTYKQRRQNFIQQPAMVQLAQQQLDTRDMSDAAVAFIHTGNPPRASIHNKKVAKRIAFSTGSA